MPCYAYADAQAYTRTEEAPDATPTVIDAIKTGAREKVRELPVWGSVVAGVSPAKSTFGQTARLPLQKERG